VYLSATNLGNADIKAEAHNVTITGDLPEGITATGTQTCFSGEHAAVCAEKDNTRPEGTTEIPPECTVAASHVSCIFKEIVRPYEQLEVRIAVQVSSEIASGTKLDDEMSISGGEAPSTSLKRPLNVSSNPVPFGIEQYELTPEADQGEVDGQAGSHPFQFTTALALNAIFHTFPEGITNPSTPQPLRNLRVDLPAGLIGNANKNVIAQCTELQFTTVLENKLANQCPPETAIGVSVTKLTEPALHSRLTIDEPVYNLQPSKGEPARFGFLAFGVPIVLDTVVREGDYHVVVNVKNASESIALLESIVTIWGVPGDERHDNSRGSQCVAGGVDRVNSEEKCEPPAERNTSPFLTLPTSCESQLQTSVTVQSWLFGSKPLSAFPGEVPPALEGCESLPFTPTMNVTPIEHRTNTPTGLKVVLHVPQTTTLEQEGLAEADIRNTIVTLPEGMQLSPSAANGLAACTLAQIGWTGFSPLGTPEFNNQPATCPDASKIGKVRIKSPVLEQELVGSVYLSAENENPFNALFGLYIVVEDEQTGVLVKLAGETKLNKATGQITSLFPNAPQLPFEELELETFNGSRAAVANPRTCGTYSTFTSFTPWSSTPSVESLLEPAEFALGSGPAGTPCANPQPFAPSFTTGTQNQQAGAYTPFTLSIERPDTDQQLNSISVTLPPGIAGLLSAVEQCPEPQASQGTCGAKSLIGHATAVAGLGNTPFTVEGGRVYITGPYNGAPFGLSVVLPAKAGPFDFGYVVTRSAIFVDPNTAQITITSAVPTMIETLGSSFPGCPANQLAGGLCHVGSPVQLKRVDVVVERPGGEPFQFNATNCAPLKIVGTLGGDQGAAASVSSPYQATGCDKLAFKPKFSAEAGGQGSKVNGTSLKVTVESGGVGVENIQKVRLALPLQLPSRLTTIQKACLEAVFNANPASCPEGSNIGGATIETPVLKSPLSGPAYLVSHGNAAFPDVEFVLKGEGVTVILDGKTDIKKGITYSRFESAPDAPFTKFVTDLPAGPHSALTAFVPVKEKYSLCKQKLVMPTEIVAQNGDVIRQNTKIKATGCKKPRKLTRKQLLAKALKACKKKHNKHKRQACERAARTKYGPKKHNKHK
jgi:hypothetical protein